MAASLVSVTSEVAPFRGVTGGVGAVSQLGSQSAEDEVSTSVPFCGGTRMEDLQGVGGADEGCGDACYVSFAGLDSEPWLSAVDGGATDGLGKMDSACFAFKTSGFAIGVSTTAGSGTQFGASFCCGVGALSSLEKLGLGRSQR
jgi:hypothetical protein